jgi:hypothetical protein
MHLIELFIAPLFTPTNTPLLPTSSESPEPELILFVGLPCVGKTSFYRRHFQPEYKHINQDTLKRREKCVQAVEEALSAGQSCVVGRSLLISLLVPLSSNPTYQITPTAISRRENFTWMWPRSWGFQLGTQCQFYDFTTQFLTLTLQMLQIRWIRGARVAQ